MKIYLASDHGGFELKRQIEEFLLEKDYLVADLGCTGTDSCDYPVFGQTIAEEVLDDEGSLGIAVCGSGIGISMAANKVHGARAALCYSVESAKLARQHNGAQILCLGERTESIDEPIEIVEMFLETDIDMSERHARRRSQLDEM